VLDGEDGGMLVYSPAGQSEDRMAMAVPLIAQEAEGLGEAGMYCVPDATCPSLAPLDDTRVC
jgi:hypothetical protein